MSGPYPPSGYPQQPAPGNWPGSQPTSGGSGTPGGGGPAGAPGSGAPGGYGQQPTYEFPAMSYGGLSGGNGGWGGGEPPPRRKRSVGRILVAVVSILVIIGGVVTAIVVLHDRQHTTQQAGPAGPTATAPSNAGRTTTAPSTTTAPVAEGTTTLTLTPGTCVTASVAGDEYAVSKQASCGAADSDFVLAKQVSTVGGCESHQYLAIQAPSAVDCFTLDIKQGDCLDNNYLKAPCATAPFAVLTEENGPGGSNSCATASGATHWVPAGVNPVKVACIGPPKA
ncbi:MAG TPA: hypothetical protein VG756_14975 [Pseudonocardiaceae bacterium]|jgi:hypothetical protein|nr:hypothetical protein [Pseudonocardiaceae bacterium]